jgi:murein DD-endopeptidase MepM/ murein hydrolase activator NlpD
VRVDSAIRQFSGWLAAYLPERQVYFRSYRETRFLIVSTRLQAGIIVGALLVLSWVSVTSANFLFRDAILADKEQTIEEMQAAFNKVTNDMRDLQLEVVERTRDLEARQAYLEDLTETDLSGPLNERKPATFGPEPLEEELAEEPTVDEPSSPFIGSAASDSFVIGSTDRFKSEITARFEVLEAAQTRLAMTLTGFASVQLEYLEKQLEGTGLRIDDLVSTWDGDHRQQLAAGGPFVPVLQPGRLNHARLEIEPAFIELASRWDALQRSHESLRSMPSGSPAADYYVSSRFGRRLDPVNKSPAMHYGLDMAAWPGTAILAAGDGVVSKAGHWEPYGKMVEIDHGNGFKTRYGHLRRIAVSIGGRLKRGQTIGEMGCSGRCTGTHLHYEVWFGGKARNPLPYLKVAQDVYQIQRRTEERYNAAHNNTETSPVSE